MFRSFLMVCLLCTSADAGCVEGVEGSCPNAEPSADDNEVLIQAKMQIRDRSDQLKDQLTCSASSGDYHPTSKVLPEAVSACQAGSSSPPVGGKLGVAWSSLHPFPSLSGTSNSWPNPNCLQLNINGRRRASPTCSEPQASPYGETQSEEILWAADGDNQGAISTCMCLKQFMVACGAPGSVDLACLFNKMCTCNGVCNNFKMRLGCNWYASPAPSPSLTMQDGGVLMEENETTKVSNMDESLTTKKTC